MCQFCGTPVTICLSSKNRVTDEPVAPYPTSDMAHSREVRPYAHELKFLLDEDVAARIREWARTHLDRDPHGNGPFGDEYHTASVYFDTDGFDGSTEGCTSGQDAAALQAIIDGPAGYYVNVHNADFPGGAVRGQLAAGTVPNTALPASDGSPTAIGFLLLALALVAGAWRLATERR